MCGGGGSLSVQKGQKVEWQEAWKSHVGMITGALNQAGLAHLKPDSRQRLHAHFRAHLMRIGLQYLD